MKAEKHSDNSQPQTSKYPFPLELVASIAVQIFVDQGRNLQNKILYDNAADAAVRLLQACEERLNAHAALERMDHENALLRKPFQDRDKEEATLKQKYGETVPFLKGLLYITGKRSEREAILPYRRWLLYRMGIRYVDAERQNFFEQSIPPLPSEANVEAELHQQRMGFRPGEVVHNRETFSKWHDEIGVPESKIRPKKS